MGYKRISSLSNPHIKEAINVRERRSKNRQNTFLIEGAHLIETALGSGAVIEEVFITDSFISKKVSRRILRLLLQKNVGIFEITGQILKRITDTETPQGIVAAVSCAPVLLDKLPIRQKPLLTVIDGIREPGNLGTIIRTSDAAGADAVIVLPGTCDVFMPKTIRSTAGSIFNMPAIHADTDNLLKWLSAKDIKLAATSADAEISVFEAALDVPLAIVFGNEAHGVSKQIKKSADLILRIPIYGKAESLNVATSAAVCLYEAVRQRKTLAITGKIS